MSTGGCVSEKTGLFGQFFPGKSGGEDLVGVLTGVERVVIAALLQQLAVPPLLHDPAVTHDEDEVGVAHGGEAVGDDEGGAAADDRVDCGLDALLRDGVHGGGRLVEDEDLRLGENGAREGDELLFAGGEQIAALADVAVEPLLKAVNDLRRGDELQRLPDLLLRGVRVAVEQIFADGAGKEVASGAHSRARCGARAGCARARHARR